MSQYLKTTGSDWYKQRLVRVMFFVAGAFLVLFARLFYLQIIQGQEMSRLSENNSVRLQTTDSSRGIIFDRNGSLLVDNRPAFDLSIILKDAKPVERTLEKLSKLSKLINLTEAELKSKINSNKGIPSYKPILLKQDIGRDALAAVEARKYDLPGIIIIVKPRRHYINRQSAAHLIGYLSEINSDELKSGKYPGNKSGDFIGKYGVEKAFEQFLKGKQGGRQVEVNAIGQVVQVLKTVDAQPGYNIYLTIDNMLQQKAESLLKGTAGAVVAMDPASGDILAMASSPSFDQNAFVDGMTHKQWNSLISNPLRPMTNKSIQGEYPPASTYKLLTAMAGLEQGIVDEQTTIYCPGYYKYGSRVYRCWKRGGHGSVNIYKALAESCDVFFYQVGQKLGVDQLAFYAKASGLGSPTGINLDNEAAGLVPTADWKKRRTGIAWQGGETLSVAIGQGFNLATPLQMLVLTSALANGGTIYQPLILKSVKTTDNKIIIQGKKKITGKLPAGKKTLSIIKKGLWEVVNNPRGTARIARISGMDISGKTGTAQVFGHKRDRALKEEDIPKHLKSHAWFVAYSPSVEPQIAVAVLIEHGGHGSSAAAPIATKIIKAYLKNGEKGKMLKAERKTIKGMPVVSKP